MAAGRQPAQDPGPRALEAERALLGCILLRNTLISDIERSVPSPEYFNAANHRTLYQRFKDLRDNGQAINYATCGLFMGSGFERKAAEYLRLCTSLAQNPDEWPTYSGIVDNAYRARLLCAQASIVYNAATQGQLLQAYEGVDQLASTRFSPNGRVWSFADIDTTPPEWVWPDWIVKGVCHLILGRKGEGKSFLSMRLAASFIRGDDWPDGTPYTGETGYVVYADAENFQRFLLQRATAMDLDHSRLLVPSGPTANFCADNPGHVGALHYLASKAEVKAVFVDGLQAAQPAAKENSPEISKLVAICANLAKQTNKPFFISHHPRKVGREELKESDGLLQRNHVRGHSSIIAQTRIIMALSRPDTSNETRVLHLAATNFQEPAPIAMRITEQGAVFDGEIPTANIQTLMDVACQVVRTLLQDGPMPYTLLRSLSESRGVTSSSLARALRRLHLVDWDSEDGRDRIWGFGLPTDEHEADEHATAPEGAEA